MRGRPPAPRSSGKPGATPAWSSSADRPYPPGTELRAVWGACVPCAEDPEVSALLEARAIRPALVDELGLARALPRSAGVPRWARFRGERLRSVPWTETGHRLLLPVYDPLGRMRSVRAWCVDAGKDPKRVPPAGYRAAGLVLACPNAVAMLATARAPNGPRARAIVTEGDPDFLTWATRYSDATEDAPAVFGVVSGSWSAEFAERIPVGSKVIVRTHADAAGEEYAKLVHQSLEGRCDVWRSKVA